MGLIHEVSCAKRIRLVEVGALNLVAAADFLLFVAGCREHDVAIVGIEGFHLHGGAAVPDMDAIADFSEMRGENLVAACAHEAERFFRQIEPTEMLFDFVLLDKA